jgi:L-fuculose-phosphate aldolase
LREAALRDELCAALRSLAAGGLVRGTEGNASARAGELVVISPSGLEYDALRAEDVCLLTTRGELLEGSGPSVELPMHLAVLAARPDVGAVVHTHSPCATARPPVPVASGVSGTPELGAAVLEAAAGGTAVVIRDHGPVCFGADLAEAVACAFAVEESAERLLRR